MSGRWLKCRKAQVTVSVNSYLEQHRSQKTRMCRNRMRTETKWPQLGVPKKTKWAQLKCKESPKKQNGSNYGSDMWQMSKILNHGRERQSGPNPCDEIMVPEKQNGPNH